MHETFGRQRVHALLTNDTETFWGPVEQELGATLAALYCAWGKREKAAEYRAKVGED